MAEHVLDRPVWTALNTVHAGLSIGSGRARRFDATISPFAAAVDEREESLVELGALVGDGGPVVIAQADPIVAPDGAALKNLGLASQMLFEGASVSEAKGLPVRRLHQQDAQAMLDLATLTKPGPFAIRTHLLGEYWGIEQDGRLVAMAGERLKQPGFTELSGVCTHPDHLGHGYARELCLVVLNRILGRGEQPYLHVYQTNEPALTLYRKLGFRERQTMHVAQLDPAAADNPRPAANAWSDLAP